MLLIHSTKLVLSVARVHSVQRGTHVGFDSFLLIGTNNMGDSFTIDGILAGSD